MIDVHIDVKFFFKICQVKIYSRPNVVLLFVQCLTPLHVW